MKINTVVIIFLWILLTAGCTPLVRYTHDHSAGRAGGSRLSGGGAGQQKEVDGVEDSLLSVWEASEGGANRRQSDWLNAELSSADQGQSGGRRRQEGGGAKGAAAQRSLEQVVSSYLGVPYKYGGTTRSGLDCSGFVSAVYREAYGIQLKRTSGAMWKDGTPVSLVTARPGDLVFFKGGAFGTIDHVGIYMGRTRFVHASSKSGVVYANLKETYYARRFAGFRRMD